MSYAWLTSRLAMSSEPKKRSRWSLTDHLARTTGITNSVVERMEGMLKDDVLREIQAGDGRILLHDEKEIKPGQYEVVPIWETVQPDDVMTPKELYDQVMKDRYRVDYARVAIVRRCGTP